MRILFIHDLKLKHKVCGRRVKVLTEGYGHKVTSVSLKGMKKATRHSASRRGYYDGIFTVFNHTDKRDGYSYTVDGNSPKARRCVTAMLLVWRGNLLLSNLHSASQVPHEAL